MSRTRSHTVLVVDDERPIVDALQGLFRRDYTVLTATNAQEALDILEKEPVHLVLSDQRMPGITGSEFLGTVRERHPESIRILMTGYSDIEAVVTAINRGHVYGYVTKPWSVPELEDLVRRALSQWDLVNDHRRLTQELQTTNETLQEAKVQLEAKVDQRTRELEALEQYKECIFRNMQSGLLVVDMDLEVVTLNPSGEKILGVTQAEARGKKLGELERLRNFDEAVEKTKSLGRLEYQELSFPRPDGDLQYVGFGTSLLLVSEDDARGVIVIFRDTTEKRRFEEQLVQSEKLAAIGELAGGVAHEINNPLGVILGFTQLLLKTTGNDAGVEKKLRHIETQTLRCRNIVQNLLKFSRKSRLDIATVDMAVLARETLDLLHKQLEVENVTVIRDIDPGPLLVRANENELQQVLFNLIVNAKDAMEGGGTLTVKALEEEGFVVLIVADTGPGIPDALQAKIWNPFFTTKAAGKGTGLGLSITRRLVKRFQGEIDLVTAPGQGTRFEIRFPVAPPLPEGPTRVAAVDEPPPRGLRILVVDDEEDILRMCGELLRPANDVTLLADARQVLDQLRTQDYDVLVLDVMMPYVDGLSLMETIRREHPALALPTIAITGRPSEALVKRAAELGVHDILAKPFGILELERSLKRATSSMPSAARRPASEADS